MQNGKNRAILMMKDGLKRLASVAFFFALFAVSAAENQFNDGIDRTDPNFIKASLLVMGPGKELYSCAGHACFRLECPTFKHDYCFSYEGESASDQIFKFFAGKLKMGMFAVPTQKFLEQYVEGGRGVRQYVLNLSPASKVRLWKLLDELVAKGAYMLFNGHALTDPAFLVLAAAYIVLFLRFIPYRAFLGRARTPSAPKKGLVA